MQEQYPVQGLPNGGNQCYQNSVLQLLLSLTAFRQYVTETVVEGPLFLAVRSFLRTYKAEGLRMFHNHHEQHDAHEYLLLLLDQLNEETKNRLCPLFFCHQVMTRFVNEDDPADTTTSFSTEPILVLPFSSSLEESLRVSQQAVVLDEWHSEQHNKKCRALRSYTISAWPTYLFILVQRGVTPHSKIIHAMEVPDMLYAYRLRGAIVHFGTPRFGHYVALVKRGDRWMLCDDMTVKPLTTEEVPPFLSQAYILLYAND
jgi:ubiquitin C-terminal hydrolase